jgi:hypothetical protein
VPLLFAATLFVSASLLFMVQPMVGKMVLPLLGGSPAVWNACMVFFQALLLLGYLYSHHVSGKYQPKRQWQIHLVVLGLPLATFVLAVIFGGRHSPIAIAESLAPGAESNPVLSVLLLLTVAIGIPFFVVSTSAPLLQKWFTFSGHPSARDPYFLYSASNFGSMMFLLGYPLFIEPNLSIIGQAWVFALGFAALAVMVTVCGYYAAHPIAVAPASALQQSGKPAFKNPQANAPQFKNGQQAYSANDANKPEPTPTADEAPTLLRKLKWIALAFVPSSMMLGVTFYMATDITSMPLLWVGPLALYLITFIIAFGRVPDWFRLVIGNLAPVLILLLIFVMISKVPLSISMELMLYMVAFFAAALMCHYELARDRPSPQYLTNFFLLMSVGGVLGGVFNSLVAPVIFPYAYEFPLILMIACLMVPRLNQESEPSSDRAPGLAGKPKPVAIPEKTEEQLQRQRQRKYLALGLDFAIPVLVGVGFYYLRQLEDVDWYARRVRALSEQLSVSVNTVHYIVVSAVPVMLCFFFVDRPLRFALCVSALLGYSVYRDTGSDVIYSDRSFFGILKVENETTFKVLRFEDGSRMKIRKIVYNRLVHGRILHGTQISSMDNDFRDVFQCLTVMNPLENFAIANAIARFDPRQEPLTYYHRSGPVGAMFHELRTRKGGADAKADFAMVGLGTGSVSCYALPGQKLTFYEIDRAVLKIVEKPWKVMNEDEIKENPNVQPIMGPFSYVDDARKRGAEVEFQIGDARLKLKENTDRRYALLLVDAFSSDSIPVHLLTKEALQLYLNRMTDDGILALHISNKFVRLEPVVAAIARDLGLTARVWNDDNEAEWPGKTASSWVALARKPEHLGSLYTEIGDLPFALEPSENGNDLMERTMVETSTGWVVRPFIDSALNLCLTFEYPKDLDKKEPGKDKTRADELNMSKPLDQAWLGWIDDKLKRVTDPREMQRLELYRRMIEKHHVLSRMNEVMLEEYGHAFRRLEIYKDVPTWTDDYSDVMRVMMFPELQWVRKKLGQPTPIEH